VTNLLLVAPVLLLLRRWRPPFGSATLLFTAVALLTTATQEFAHGELVAAAAAGGLLADWSIARWGRGADPVAGHRLVAVVAPLGLWSAYFLVLQLRDGVAWAAELWTGSILFASLSGLALSLLMLPPVPASAPEALGPEPLARRRA
jgi:hypothetical protein